MASQVMKSSFMISVLLIGIISSADERPVVPLQTLTEIIISNNNQEQNSINGNRQSFAEILEQMNEAMKKESDPCDRMWYHPLKPKFEDLRISEIQCLDHIWNVKTTEETMKRMSQCKYIISGVTGGVTADLGDYPHMGAVGWKGEKKDDWVFKCGSFLISKRFALTAAHCRKDTVTGDHPSIVRLGVANIANINKTNTKWIGQDIKIEIFTAHEKYSYGSKNYDIAVIKLKTEAVLSDTVQPACILSQYEQVKKALITGWGTVNKNNVNTISEDLQVAEVNVLTPKECKIWKFKQDKTNLADFMCTRHKDKKADICAGDSGGPLQTKLQANTNTSIYNVIGITSFNDECQSQRFPSYYTKVSSYIDWIEKQVWGAEINKTLFAEGHKSTKNDLFNNSAVDTPPKDKPSKENIVMHLIPDFNNVLPIDESKGSGRVYIDEGEIAKTHKLKENWSPQTMAEVMDRDTNIDISVGAKETRPTPNYTPTKENRKKDKVLDFNNILHEPKEGKYIIDKSEIAKRKQAKQANRRKFKNRSSTRYYKSKKNDCNKNNV